MISSESRGTPRQSKRSAGWVAGHLLALEMVSPWHSVRPVRDRKHYQCVFRRMPHVLHPQAWVSLVGVKGGHSTDVSSVGSLGSIATLRGGAGFSQWISFSRTGFVFRNLALVSHANSTFRFFTTASLDTVLLRLKPSQLLFLFSGILSCRLLFMLLRHAFPPTSSPPTHLSTSR